MQEKNKIFYTEYLEKTESDPEKLLFLAVILQALLDATKPRKKTETETSIVARDQAKAWFFASVGVTCSNFELVCENAGLEPTYVRGFAYKVLESKEIKYVRKRINKILNQ
tara:strand:- start:137 stop:469 length:333 start_codon:yes stop_codon:yes gene_type:complete